MTKAEKEMVKYLLAICGGDNCRKCIHCDKPTCCQYVSSTDYSGKLDDDYCIDGMVKYFEQKTADK